MHTHNNPAMYVHDKRVYVARKPQGKHKTTRQDNPATPLGYTAEGGHLKMGN